MEQPISLPLADTPLATVRVTAADRMEVRFKHDVTFTVEGIQEMMRARQRLGTVGPHKVLVVMPAYVDFELDMISTDHYEAVPQPNTQAVAWVAGSERNAVFTRIYLKYFPTPFPSEVFLTEEEGRLWLGW